MEKIHIILSPQRRDDSLQLERHGTTLRFNGDPVDILNYDPDSAPCDWIAGKPERTPEGWTLTIILPHGPAAPESTRFPAPLSVTSDGVISLPDYGPKVSYRSHHDDDEAFSPPRPARIPRPADYPSLVNFYADVSALDAIPESRIAISDTLAYWAATDTHLRIFLQTRFGSDPQAVSDLLTRMRSDDALPTLLRIASGMTCDPVISAACTKFLQHRGEVKSFRDTFAHGTWLLSPDHAGQILIAKSDDFRQAMQEGNDQDYMSFGGLRLRFEAWRPEDFHRAQNCSAALRNEAILLTGQFPPAR